MKPARDPGPVRRELRACFCSGPRPGHSLCPCQERNRREEEVMVDSLRRENDRLRRLLEQRRDVIRP